MAQSFPNITETREDRKPSPIEMFGIKFPDLPLFKRDLILKAYKFRPKSKQIVLSSYPKCDSKYLEVILWKLVHPECQELPWDEATERCLTCMEMVGVGESSKIRSPKITKTYLPLPAIMYQKNVKYIYVVRNPWEACLSYYRLMSSDGIASREEFDQFFKDFVKGDVGYGNFFTHILQWEAMADKDNVIILFHENIRHNIRSTVFTVAAFLGDEYLAQLTGDDGFLVKLLNSTGWDKRQLRRFQKGRSNFLSSIIAEPLDSVNELMWRRRFELSSCSAEQLKVLADKIANVMKYSNVEYMWHGLLQKQLDTLYLFIANRS